MLVVLWATLVSKISETEPEEAKKFEVQNNYRVKLEKREITIAKNRWFIARQSIDKPLLPFFPEAQEGCYFLGLGSIADGNFKFLSQNAR